MKENDRKLIIKASSILIFAFLILSVSTASVEARRGCCSWHGGVCTYKCPDGVNVGYMCCDGTSLSAKCAPYYSKCPTKPTPECPSHSTYNPSSDSCECNYGYIALGSECIDGDTYCHDKYGSHSSYDTLSKSCECDYGHILDSSDKCVSRDKYCEDLHGYHTHYNSFKKGCECDYGYELINGKCVKPEPIEEQPPAKEQSTEESAIEEEQPAKEQSSGQPPTSQRGLPAPEKLTAEIPKENSGGGSIFGWIIGIGVVAILFYVFKTRKKRKKDYERKN